jgi:hypothetical protein
MQLIVDGIFFRLFLSNEPGTGEMGQRHVLKKNTQGNINLLTVPGSSDKKRGKKVQSFIEQRGNVWTESFLCLVCLTNPAQ